MPHIEVACPSGTHQFFYSIATPTSPNATAIEKDLPVILFIHSGYTSQEVFECQFADPELRQFNLVAIDVPGHGATLGYIGDQKYTPTETAHDFKHVMDALGITPCHIFGLSNGGTVAFELACAYPADILSLTICSPLTPAELDDVAAGRIQVYNYWRATFQDGSNTREARRKQDDLLDETLLGAMQLLYNNEENHLITALGRCGMVRAIDIWSGSKEKLKQSHAACITWFTERREIPRPELARIQCPVTIIHCSEDLGYPLENAEALVQELKEAGVGRVELHTTGGPHYGNIASANKINPLLRDVVLYVHQMSNDHLPKPDPEVDGKVRTPWTELLQRLGYHPKEDCEDEDEDDWPYLSWFDVPPVVEEARRANSPSPS